MPRGSLWEYVGEEKHCKGTLHCVIHYERGEVVTWGQPLNFKNATTKRAGDTWLGDEKAFLRDFKPAVSGKPFNFI